MNISVQENLRETQSSRKEKKNFPKFKFSKLNNSREDEKTEMFQMKNPQRFRSGISKTAMPSLQLRHYFYGQDTERSLERS